jgi:hypothetical protein
MASLSGHKQRGATTEPVTVGDVHTCTCIHKEFQRVLSIPQGSYVHSGLAHPILAVRVTGGGRGREQHLSHCREIPITAVEKEALVIDVHVIVVIVLPTAVQGPADI